MMTGMVMQQPAAMAQQKGMKVMVAIDGSEGSFYALGWSLNYVDGGVEEDRSGKDSVELLTLVHVQQPFQHYVFPAGPGGTVKAETLVLSGDLKDMTCQATEQMHTYLLVVGCRGLGKIERAFLGSASDYCAYHAKCPILVKPPK